MTGLPQGWAIARLDEVTTPRGEKADPATLGELPFLGMDHIEANTANLLGSQPVGELKSAVAIFKSGDLLYGRLRPYLNKVHLAGFDGAASAEFIVFPPQPAIEQRYLQCILRSPEYRAIADQRSTGDRPRVKFEDVGNYEIPLPPLPEQRRIVRKLDTLSARSTTARTHLTAVEKLVERYKLAVLSGSLFRNGTPVKRLGEVLTDIRYGTAAKCSYDPSGTPVLRIPNIQSGRIDRTDLKSAHFAKKEIEQLALKAGDILVIRSNGSPDLVGRVALVTDGETDCLFAGYLIRLRLSATEALPEYVRLCFESDEVRAIIEAASKSTSGVNNVNSTQLKEIALPMPTVDEQREIVRRIETAFGKIDRLAAEAAKALKLLGHLDQRILAKAFAGDLVPQDPTDEPAETLLARIREARATAPTRKRGRKAKA